MSAQLIQKVILPFGSGNVIIIEGYKVHKFIYVYQLNAHIVSAIQSFLI